jgi:nitroimidazol reductase NimA-like FMN-containing flavoprotein (pyridoxamine 5'-phosphate oxidase superfamily)
VAEVAPVVERPRIPKEYGIAETGQGLLDWAWVEERLAAARNYWVVTASPDRGPHAMPVWGLWLDGTLQFSTGRSSRKARNLAADPRVTVHLESGDDVVVVSGVARELTDPGALARFSQAYQPKYGMAMPAETLAALDGLVYAVPPAVVLAWRETDMTTSATRFRFPER